ncbi:DUF2737 family protein [Escherichia coli]|nr:DUF2737 family protein [Escherichia coli]ELC7868804.1 DUF2737 family protein [Escherichia coli]
MRGLAYNPGILPAEMIIRQRVKPMPSREELLKRNSFGSVNDNRYLEMILKAVVITTVKDGENDN